jgi:hypothetical protein
MMLHTQRDRAIHRLRQEIRQVEVWIEVDAADRRALAWHLARLQALQDELNQLLEDD